MGESFYLWDTGSNESLCSYIDKKFFRSLKLAYNYLHISEFLQDSLEDADNENGRYVFYCEAIYTIIDQLMNLKIDFDSDDTEWIRRQIDSIERIIETNASKLNLVLKKIETDIGSIIILIPNNSLVEETLEYVENTNVQNYLIEYSSVRNNGNIERKEEILKLLATTVEGITKQEKYKNKFKQLCSNVDLLYNKLDLRHNVRVKDRRYYDRTISSREKWLDLVFRETLLVLNLENHYDDLNDVEALKQEIEKTA